MPIDYRLSALNYNPNSVAVASDGARLADLLRKNKAANIALDRGVKFNNFNANFSKNLAGNVSQSPQESQLSQVQQVPQVQQVQQVESNVEPFDLDTAQIELDNLKGNRDKNQNIYNRVIQSGQTPIITQDEIEAMNEEILQREQQVQEEQDKRNDPLLSEQNKLDNEEMSLNSRLKEISIRKQKNAALYDIREQRKLLDQQEAELNYPQQYVKALYEGGYPDKAIEYQTKTQNGNPVDNLEGKLKLREKYKKKEEDRKIKANITKKLLEVEDSFRLSSTALKDLASYSYNYKSNTTQKQRELIHKKESDFVNKTLNTFDSLADSFGNIEIGKAGMSLIRSTIGAANLGEYAQFMGQRIETAVMLAKMATGSSRVPIKMFEELLKTLPSSFDNIDTDKKKIEQSYKKAWNMYYIRSRNLGITNEEAWNMTQNVNFKNKYLKESNYIEGINSINKVFDLIYKTSNKRVKSKAKAQKSVAKKENTKVKKNQEDTLLDEL